jgi:hemerythrin-like domain-containing protein
MRFSRLIALIEREMTAFHAGLDPDFKLIRDAVHYLHNYADQVHHPREDEAFKHLARRNPAFQFTVDRLMQEHRAIAVAGRTLLELLEEILGNAMLERASVESAAALYISYFRSHLITEEREVLPHAAALLTQEDWAAVDAAVTGIPDPLFGGDVAAEYHALRGRISGVL